MKTTDSGEHSYANHPVLLQAILDSFHSGIHIFHAIRNDQKQIVDFEFVLLSKKSAVFGDGSRLSGKRLFEEFPEYRNELESLKLVVETGVSKTHEKHIRKEGKDRCFLVSESKFGDGFVNVWEEITEHKQAEEKIRELNRSLLINNRELASLNSELKTFNSIAATDYTDTLRKLYTNLEFIIFNEARHLSDEGKANVRRAQSAIQKMKLLTEDIVAYSRIHTHDTDLEPVDLVQLLHHIQDDMRRIWPGLEIKVGCEDNMPHIQGYPFLLSLLFHHLIDNAVKFRKENTHPVIDVNCEPSSESDHPSAIPGTRYNIYKITDEGIGFDMEHAEDIFLIFHRLHPKGAYKGSGIGLAICRKIMDIHGGFITAESGPNRGASFHCYFPVQAE